MLKWIVPIPSKKGVGQYSDMCLTGSSSGMAIDRSIEIVIGLDRSIDRSIVRPVLDRSLLGNFAREVANGKVVSLLYYAGSCSKSVLTRCSLISSFQ